MPANNRSSKFQDRDDKRRNNIEFGIRILLPVSKNGCKCGYVKS
jgi:hypothetical protein